MSPPVVPGAARSIRVVVADHHPMVRAGFAALLDATPRITVVGEAADGGEAIHLVLATHPDVVLLDPALPVVDGIETTRRVREAHASSPSSAPRVLIVAPPAADGAAYEGIRAGASGFVPRDARADELVEGVRRVAADDGLVSPGRLLRLVGELTRLEPGSTDLARRMATLDDSQSRILRAVAAGYDDESIAGHFGVEPSRVAAAVAAVRDALGAAHRTDLVVLAHRSGLASWADAAPR